MSNITRAELLAQFLDSEHGAGGSNWNKTIAECAAELRRLAESERALLEALEDLADAAEEAWGPDRPCVRIALSVIAATKEARNAN